MKWTATAFAAALLVAGAQPGQAQMSPPVVDGAIVPVMPDPAAREGLSGCCRTQFKVGRSGKIRDISAECTSPIFRDAAIAAIREAGYKPAKILGIAVTSSQQSQIVAFEQPGEAGICRSGDEAWEEVTYQGEEVFPFLTVKTVTLKPYVDEADKRVGIARGWADYYTTLDFATPCGPAPAYQPPMSQSKTIDTMGWDALRRTGAAFEKVFAWMNCRDDMLAGYGAQAAEWHAAYDSATPDEMEHWVGGAMDRRIRAERGRYDLDRQLMIAYGSQILRREQALRARDAAEQAASAADVTPDAAALPSPREVVPTYRAPNTLRREWSAADQFFYERGPGHYQACLDRAATYGAQQDCLSALHGSD